MENKTIFYINLYYKNSIFIFFQTCFLFLLFHFIIDRLYFTDEVFFAHYYDVYSTTKLNHLIELRHKWYWVSYVIFPFLFLVKCIIPAAIIYLGMYIDKMEVSFSSVFKVVVISQLVFIIPEIIKLVWFNYNPISMDALRSFHPFSLYSLFDPILLQEWLKYPFKILSLFEVLYWFAIALFLSNFLKRGFDEMLKIVVVYYGSFLFCWMVFVMFISISNS
ncbi:hypothetical protein [Algoriphagus winogradskyi]|nr:hypothetical protein [Algoriphagus winogradskyi]